MADAAVAAASLVGDAVQTVKSLVKFDLHFVQYYDKKQQATRLVAASRFYAKRITFNFRKKIESKTFWQVLKKAINEADEAYETLKPYLICKKINDESTAAVMKRIRIAFNGKGWAFHTTTEFAKPGPFGIVLQAIRKNLLTSLIKP